MALGGAAGGDGLVGFEAGQRRTTTRLLDGEYPKVTSIFPTSVDTESVLETAALVEAVRRVSLVAERNTPVRLKFTDGQVAIEAGTGDDAQASEAVEATLTGPDIEIAFNPHFLLDGSAPSAPRTRGCRSPSRAAPAVLVRPGRGRRRPRRELPYVLDAGAFRHDRARQRPAVAAMHARSCVRIAAPPCTYRHTAVLRAPRGLRAASFEQRLGLIGLGKMGGNMRERLRRAGHEVVGYDRDPGLDVRAWPRWSRRSTPRAPCG